MDTTYKDSVCVISPTAHNSTRIWLKKDRILPSLKNGTLNESARAKLDAYSCWSGCDNKTELFDSWEYPKNLDITVIQLIVEEAVGCKLTWSQDRSVCVGN